MVVSSARKSLLPPYAQAAQVVDAVLVVLIISDDFFFEHALRVKNFVRSSSSSVALLSNKSLRLFSSASASAMALMRSTSLAKLVGRHAVNSVETATSSSALESTKRSSSPASAHDSSFSGCSANFASLGQIFGSQMTKLFSAVHQPSLFV